MPEAKRNSCLPDQGVRQVGGAEMGGGRILAQVGEAVPVRTVGDEIDPAAVVRVAADRGAIEPLALPEGEKGIARFVAAESGDDADRRSLPGGRDGGVRGISAKSLKIKFSSCAVWGKLGEFEHRLAHAEEGGRAHAAACTAWAAARMAARSPAAIRPSSTRAPPMPTKAAPAAR